MEKEIESRFDTGTVISAEVCDETFGLLLDGCKEFLVRERLSVYDN